MLRTTGRLIGMLAGGITAALWVYLIWIPIGDFMLDSVIGLVVGGLMGLFGLVAAIAGYHGHATVLFVCFVASFFGVGAFSLNVDSWFRIFGILDLLLLLASVMIWYSGRGEEKTQ